MSLIFLKCLCAVLSRSVVSDSAIPWTAIHQAPLFMGILQARILEWVAMLSSRGSSQPRDRTLVSHIGGRFFTVSATSGYWWNCITGRGVHREGCGRCCLTGNYSQALVIGLGPPSVGRSGVRKTREIWTSLYVSMSVCHCVSLPSLVESNGPCFTSDY